MRPTLFILGSGLITYFWAKNKMDFFSACLAHASDQEPISCVSLKKITMPCVPLEKFSGLQRHNFNFFCVLHATSVSLGSNTVKLQVGKDENTLKSKYVINFFEHLNDFKWKSLKLKVVDLVEIYNFHIKIIFI